ncbi:hypothetical protein H9L39_07602 [Fusarium oxysporum f. sp. albedinis]|nr:hypothetical protein H9L39_07602 [Fusarium oxysporum f. sp. albedinis]
MGNSEIFGTYISEVAYMFGTRSSTSSRDALCLLLPQPSTPYLTYHTTRLAHIYLIHKHEPHVGNQSGVRDHNRGVELRLQRFDVTSELPVIRTPLP